MDYLIKISIFFAGVLVMFIFYEKIQTQQHQIWDMAFERGYTQAESFYKGILEIEMSDEVVEARCMLFNFDFKKEK